MKYLKCSNNYVAECIFSGCLNPWQMRLVVQESRLFWMYDTHSNGVVRLWQDWSIQTHCLRLRVTWLSDFFISKIIILHCYYTVADKIIRALELIRVNKLIPNAVWWNNFFSKSWSLGFILFITSMKWQKIGNQTAEKSDVLLKVLE